VARRRAFLVTGGTGSGKTTLLSALLGDADPADRIVLCEDAAELTPAHPHVVRLLARPPNVEGVGQVTLRDLVRQALRMRPDRLVVGEVRGAEVSDLLAALNTGHDGGCGTLHANTVSGSLVTRLPWLCMVPARCHAVFREFRRKCRGVRRATLLAGRSGERHSTSDERHFGRHRRPTG
jgi:Flp pilus assembly CpaF family ATPase